MNTPEYLYHYTSLDNLAFILENRTIRFNSLLNVDDIEEAETSDIKNFGKYVLVSCWTNEEQEMIPMWTLYTPNMSGVRIRLPVHPFERYHYKAGEYNFSADNESCIDYEKIYRENRGALTPNMPLLEPVNYTNELDKLFPKVRTKGTAEDARRFISGSSQGSIEITYSLAELGRNKREVWSFQKEWRYILWFSPMGLQENKSIEQHRELIRRMEDEEREPPYQHFYLRLRQDAVNQMEVVFGPRMSEAQKILAKALLREHGLEGHWQNSSLKIR